MLGRLARLFVAEAIHVRFMLALAAMLGLAPRSGWAYVRDVTKTGVPAAWRNPCVAMHIYLGSPPPVATAEQLLGASTAAATAWSYPALNCTDIRLSMVPEPQTDTDVGNDGRNVIVFRRDTWCRRPPPAQDAEVPEAACYAPAALAVTTTFKNTRTGEIVDGDIEINAVYFSWGDFVAQPALATPTTVDFQNTLTHELGHVLGLAHPCFSLADGQPRLPDNTGVPELDCYGNPSLPKSIAEATMYPSVQMSDTTRRDLASDDALGICEIYPHVHDVCPANSSGGGCTLAAPASPSSGHGWLLGVPVALGLLLALVGFPRSRKSRH